MLTPHMPCCQELGINLCRLLTVLLCPPDRAVNASLLHPSLDSAAIWHHLQTVEDTEALRAALPGLGLVGFVGDGAILPRKRYHCCLKYMCFGQGPTLLCVGEEL